MLIAMLVPMTSVTLSGCNGKNEVSNATPDQATTQITTQQITTHKQNQRLQKLHKLLNLIITKPIRRIKPF